MIDWSLQVLCRSCPAESKEKQSQKLKIVNRIDTESGSYTDSYRCSYSKQSSTFFLWYQYVSRNLPKIILSWLLSEMHFKADL